MNILDKIDKKLEEYTEFHKSDAQLRRERKTRDKKRGSSQKRKESAFHSAGTKSRGFHD